MKIRDIITEDIQEVDEDSMSLRDWFGKGKHGGAGGGGWDRYNTKGERIGKCGERKSGEGKPKCLSKAKAASLRASGGKKAIASAVRKKRLKDPSPNREGSAKMVSNKTRKTSESSLFESNDYTQYFATMSSGRPVLKGDNREHLLDLMAEQRKMGLGPFYAYEVTPEQWEQISSVMQRNVPLKSLFDKLGLEPFHIIEKPYAIRKS